MSNQYIVITPSDDGAYIEQVPEEELLERVNTPDWYGPDAIFLDKLPNDECNTAYWPENAVLILKAEFIVPKPAEVVRRYIL